MTIEITQADRDCADAIRNQPVNWVSRKTMDETIAEHRIAATAELRAENQRLFVLLGEAQDKAATDAMAVSERHRSLVATVQQIADNLGSLHKERSE